MHRLLVASVLSNALLSGVCFATRPAFTTRPDSFAPLFPSPSLFAQADGRRLQATGAKPSRVRYELEEDGHRFAYEFAGEAGDVRILDVDRSPSVTGVACKHEENEDGFGRIWIRWHDSEVGKDDADVGAVRAGDIITGGLEWNCELGGDGGFLQRIVAVDGKARPGELCFLTRPTSPFEIFRNLYIDFSWARVQTPGRRLETWSHDETISYQYNYNNATRKAAESIPIGPLVCESCYGTLDVVVQLTLETDGATPTRTKLRIGGALHAEIDINVGSAVQSALASDWARVTNITGPDLLALAGMTIPLFNSVNSASLNLKVIPTYTMAILSDATLEDLLEGERVKIVADTSPANTFFELEWTPSAGYSTAMDFQLIHDVQVPDAYKVERLLLLGLQFCVGLTVTAGGSSETLTDMQVCPELLTLITQKATQRRLGAAYSNRLANAERLLEQNTASHDAQLCIDLLSFQTDSYADWFDLDGAAEPFAKACFFGKCVQTSHQNRFGGRTNQGNCKCNMNKGGCGQSSKWCYVDSSCPVGQASSVPGMPNWAWCDPNKVNWFTGPQCIEIATESLDSNEVVFHVLEHDPIFDDQYIVPFRVRLGDNCKTSTGCNLTLSDVALAPGYARAGTTALVEANVTLTSLRRLEANGDDHRLLASVPGTDVQLQVGVNTSFGGFRYPSFFNKGATTIVVDPVQGPTLKPKPVTTLFVPSPTPPPEEGAYSANVGATIQPLPGLRWAPHVLFLCRSLHIGLAP